jgi:hypothetical protein
VEVLGIQGIFIPDPGSNNNKEEKNKLVVAINSQKFESIDKDF